MRRMAGLVVTMTLFGCTGAAPGPTAGTAADTTTTSNTPISTLPEIVECPGSGDFEEGGGIAAIDGEGTDASSLGRISWASSDQCETFVFDFQTLEGAPATTMPEVSIAHLESFQVIRINLGVTSTVITDQLVETALVDRLYVVRSLAGEVFVDLHLSAPAAARARAESSPARLTVDLRPGFVDFAGNSVTGERVVVVSPGTGAGVDPVTQFMGYARIDGSSITLIVTQSDDVVTESTTTPADFGGAWGEFRHEIGLPPGNVSVFVGEADTEDGGLEGVTVDLAVG